jgi:hypothetical protein
MHAGAAITPLILGKYAAIWRLPPLGPLLRNALPGSEKTGIS